MSNAKELVEELKSIEKKVDEAGVKKLTTDQYKELFKTFLPGDNQKVWVDKGSAGRGVGRITFLKNDLLIILDENGNYTYNYENIKKSSKKK